MNTGMTEGRRPSPPPPPRGHDMGDAAPQDELYSVLVPDLFLQIESEVGRGANRCDLSGEPEETKKLHEQRSRTMCVALLARFFAFKEAWSESPGAEGRSHRPGQEQREEQKREVLGDHTKTLNRELISEIRQLVVMVSPGTLFHTAAALEVKYPSYLRILCDHLYPLGTPHARSETGRAGRLRLCYLSSCLEYQALENSMGRAQRFMEEQEILAGGSPLKHGGEIL